MNTPRVTAKLEKSARGRRFRLFSQLFSNISRPDRPTRILDVGGTWEYWSQMEWPTLGNVEVVLLNLFVQHPLPPGFTSVLGDARDLSDYDKEEFDTVHSNSTLGHVGTFEDQMRMAAEIRRVGRSYFIQTPNPHFFVDWRTLVPFFHFLPAPAQAWCFRHFRVGTYPRISDYSASLHQATRIRNVHFTELNRLFPEGTIVPERIAGLTKSFVVHSGFSVRRERPDDSPYRLSDAQQSPLPIPQSSEHERELFSTARAGSSPPPPPP